jgi:hypothetical protein
MGIHQFQFAMRIPNTTTLQIMKPLPKPNNRDVLAVLSFLPFFEDVHL